MPKILNDKTKGLSDSDQMIMALFSESGENPARGGETRGLKTPDDRMADDLSDSRKTGLLDKFRFGRRL